MQIEDRIRIQHMIDVAEDALRFVSGRTPADLTTDRMLSFAVVRAVEIIGEAASKVSAEARKVHGDIPWEAIIGMRHRLGHAYFDINQDVVWVAVTEEIPDLLPRLRALIETE